MRIPNVNMAYYINVRTIESVYRALDMPLPKTITDRTMNGYGGEEEDGEIVEEEVVDQINYNDNMVWLSLHVFIVGMCFQIFSVSAVLKGIEGEETLCFSQRGNNLLWTMYMIMGKVRPTSHKIERLYLK